MTILALDLGKKKVGLALSHGIVAEGYATIRFNEDNISEFINKLKKIVSKQKVSRIIIGLPLGRGGKDTDQSIWTKKIAKRIENSLSLNVTFVEESYSTFQASGEGGDVDRQSARIILEQYLNENQGNSL